MMKFVNISTYKFAPLTDLKALRTRLLGLGKKLGLKGTILLSTEGINLFVAGTEASIERLLLSLRSIPGLEDLTPKFSESEHQPFNRMLVRIKKEIIAFGVEGIDPAKRTSPKLPPKELKAWLDEGRPVTLLDTRNDYEIKLGTFKNALPIGVKHFREFPKAVAGLSPELKEAPIVMFCTGGIRCEKAGPYMESQGFKNIFQLDGGILKYFEECGSHHYEGSCFVFDQRVGLDPTLHETEAAQCFACLTPLTAEDQLDKRYEKGVSCPYCYKRSEDQMRASIENRYRLLAQETSPLPGSEPYNQIRPLKVPAKYDGKTLMEFFKGALKHVSEESWNLEFSRQRILGPDKKPVTPDQRIKVGERYFHLTPNESEPEINTDIKIQYEDEAIIVLEKPAPLPVHPCGRYNRNTLKYLLDKIYAPQRPRIAHRLDADTTGVVLASRTKHFAGLLQPQFYRREVDKTYLARVHGHPPEDEFSCDLPVTDDINDTGARTSDSLGLLTRTEFKVLKRFSDGTSLLEAKPITGRTNQIRIHLWELGFPICGDQRYLKNRTLGSVKTLEVSESPLCLHAQKISFTHPVSKKRMTFSAREATWACQ